MNAKFTHILGVAIALTATLGVSGCASNKPAFSSGNVAYGDTAVQENLTNEISSNDFTKLAKSMTDSLEIVTKEKNQQLQLHKLKIKPVNILILALLRIQSKISLWHQKQWNSCQI